MFTEEALLKMLNQNESELKSEKVNINPTNEMELNDIQESFDAVEMLYVPMEVESVLLHALIDSSAQTTVMSAKTAEKCGLEINLGCFSKMLFLPLFIKKMKINNGKKKFVRLLKLMDTRFAKKNGASTIVGRVHAAKLKFGH
ncbi:DNA-damage inducible protein DDI1-like protein [Reticulomyxa filosa]|uniref:DNA-damage inducible protein DDI1-like protein n=1 Tax=Reticulomyxa filosa TaxID=46433 RepID=X6MXK1_RETFI|nr:DNA-damage inducible protein DDI1-like protein [Reticulomyxa filosa]|eukprot:ETO18549.1 DNA-damage inducible protein DDI1-like protein [Reticulomyxa filosa]